MQESCWDHHGLAQHLDCRGGFQVERAIYDATSIFTRKMTFSLAAWKSCCLNARPIVPHGSSYIYFPLGNATTFLPVSHASTGTSVLGALFQLTSFKAQKSDSNQQTCNKSHFPLFAPSYAKPEHQSQKVLRIQQRRHSQWPPMCDQTERKP